MKVKHDGRHALGCKQKLEHKKLYKMDILCHHILRELGLKYKLCTILVHLWISRENYAEISGEFAQCKRLKKKLV